MKTLFNYINPDFNLDIAGHYCTPVIPVFLSNGCFISSWALEFQKFCTLFQQEITRLEIVSSRSNLL